MKKIAAITIVVLFAALAVHSAGPRTITRNLSAAGIEVLDLNSGIGDVEFRAIEGIDEIRIEIPGPVDKSHTGNVDPKIVDLETTGSKHGGNQVFPHAVHITLDSTDDDNPFSLKFIFRYLLFKYLPDIVHKISGHHQVGKIILTGIKFFTHSHSATCNGIS